VPELPEVETERGRLAARIEGRRISVARIDDPRLAGEARMVGRLSGDASRRWSAAGSTWSCGR
jgi:formamidopyrimidine-DNA glycosylase